MLCFAIFGKVGKSVFSPTSLTEGLRPRPSWHASSVQQKKFSLVFRVNVIFAKEKFRQSQKESGPECKAERRACMLAHGMRGSLRCGKVREVGDCE